MDRSKWLVKPYCAPCILQKGMPTHTSFFTVNYMHGLEQIKNVKAANFILNWSLVAAAEQLRTLYAPVYVSN